MNICPKIKPVLDTEFLPAKLWNDKFREKCGDNGRKIVLAVERPDKTVSIYQTSILPDSNENLVLNLKYVERILKFLLWSKGGRKITIAGAPEISLKLSNIYSEKGLRRFDNELIGKKVYDKKLEICSCELKDAPSEKEINVKLGGNWKGCRIGFDLGGSDRKCASVIDGKVIFTEEVKWNPYFEKDPAWHKEGINHSLKLASEKMPRVDAIGGSAAGVYVDNKVKVASLFRGVSEDDFQSRVRNIFIELAKDWNNVPFVVANDGEVTALQGAMSLKAHSLLGISMGTSQAAGYVTPKGFITNWLNELAFAPVDYRDNAPADEWSGDIGCGVQYFSQQAVARLAPLAGIRFESSLPFAERLSAVQELMEKEDQRARRIYETIGVYFGYSVAHYSDFYEIENLLILGRVSSGTGGEIIIKKAEDVLKAEFPCLHEKIKLHTPDEKMKRHGQAVAAASLPSIT